MTRRSASASVEVPVDPATAFRVFTEEIDLWWVRGPINFFNSARAVGMRIEPGAGGRVLELYESDVLELGRITIWEPGARLVYRSSVDDTEVDIRFEPTGAGTLVRVEQSLVEGGERAFLFWPKVTHPLRIWCGERDTVPHEIREQPRLGVVLRYPDPLAAARWLGEVFGITSRWGPPPESDSPGWTELNVGAASVILLPGKEAIDPESHTVWVYVSNVDEHYAHAKAAGATIVSELEQHGYRAYTAEDPYRHRWTFAQARPTQP
ncbi:MAG: hypothetical protein J2P15_12515 [Micromonosporaceae bacterium]|nr:hypothetical protein [Micromonosporaceae bacterium]